VTNENEIQSNGGAFAAWVFADGVRSLAQLFRVSQAQALGMLAEEVGEPVERVREWAHGIFGDARDRVRFGDAVEALERGPISDLKAKLRAEYDRAQQEKETDMDKEAVLDKARQVGEKLKAKPHDEANARARKVAAKNAARGAEERRNQPMVFFDEDGAWLNDAILRRVFGEDVGLDRSRPAHAVLSDAIPKKKFTEKQVIGDLTVEWECRLGEAIQAFLDTGVLGGNMREAVRIVTCKGPHDFVPPRAEGGGIVVSPDALVDPYSRKLFRPRLKVLHDVAVGKLSLYSHPGRVTLQAKARGIEPGRRAPHLTDWAAKDPANLWGGITKSIEECLPLEVGLHLRGQRVWWIRRLPKEA